jgi:alpha-1,3-fucosyltransferase 10
MYTIQEKNAFRKELAPVAWIVSSCRAKNGRHLYVTQLLKYIKVDVYGHCMSNKAWPKHPGKIEELFFHNFVASFPFCNAD